MVSAQLFIDGPGWTTVLLVMLSLLWMVLVLNKKAHRMPESIWNLRVK